MEISEGRGAAPPLRKGSFAGSTGLPDLRRKASCRPGDPPPVESPLRGFTPDFASRAGVMRDLRKRIDPKPYIGEIMNTRQDIYTRITTEIVEAIEAGAG